MRRRSGLLTTSFLMAACLVGCGSETDKPTLIPVAGTVSVDGEPLADADLEFHFDGEAPEGYTNPVAHTDEQGTFEVQSERLLGALPGTHKVTVRTDNEALAAYEKLDTTTATVEVSANQSRGYEIELTTD